MIRREPTAQPYRYIGALALSLAACTAGTTRSPGWGQDRAPDTTLPTPDGQSGPSGPGGDPAYLHGVVTTTEPLAAQVGAAVLGDGGNAVDAAAAVLFMLNVVEPQGSGIGGGGFMMIHLAAKKETVIVSSRERAPAAATPTMFVSQPDFGLRATSGYAVGVPGAVRGVALALERWGTLSLADALQPAIEAAEHGVIVSARLAAEIALPGLSAESAASPVRPAYDVARAVFRPDGAPLRAGDLLVQPELARTFRLIADGGPDAFYDCDHPAGIARAIVATQRVTRERNPDGQGRMTCADLAAYEAELLTPISRPYRGYDIVTVPPPASGGVGLLQMLGMLERFPLGDGLAGYGFGQVDTYNVMLEAMRLAFADRALWLGDQTCPGCPMAPLKGLLARPYLDERSAQIRPGRRQTKIRAGDPRPHDPDFGELGVLAYVQEADEDRGGSTTHFTIVDADGNIVTYTTSIASVWGTGLMVPGYGFLLNDQLTDFNPVPRLRAGLEHLDPGANDVAPFKRPRSGMAPTIVLLDGEPVAAYGSPGGPTIANTVLEITLALIDHRQSLRQAVLAPRLSLTSASNSATTDIEPGIGLHVRKRLNALDYRLRLVDTLGAVQAIITIPATGEQYGAADPRRIGGLAAAPPRP